MGECQILAAPDALVGKLESLLEGARIDYQREPDTAFVQGRHTYELTSFQCNFGGGTVSLGIEKRRHRSGVYIVLMVPRSFIFFRNCKAEVLAEKLVLLLCEHGATVSPDARCESLESTRH